MVSLRTILPCFLVMLLQPAEAQQKETYRDESRQEEEIMTRVDRAKADLADRLGAAAGGIAVELEEEVTWPDGSIGCPRKGMAYRQQLVNGSRLMLRVGETLHAYHAAGGGAYFYCPTPAKPLRSSLSDQ